ncbi:MAG: adenine deaminase, partial [Victivallales bacterium]|nr:adenine deaminase [Victivallales bacterium]
MKTGISVALKRVKADLVIKNANIFHLTTGKFELADIAIVDGLIAGIGHGYPADAEFDAQGKTAVPGFIDAHVHIESSMVTPRQFEQCVLPHGVTTVACDPHELANVVGEAAFEYFFSAAEGMDLDMQVRLSSCVPATPLETAGAAITADVLKNWHQRYPSAWLAEFMNVPGVLFEDPEVMAKLRLFDYIDGHCPLLSGDGLNAYVFTGIRNCHETSTVQEAEEKISRGMHIFIREGTAARNLDELMPIITLQNAPYIAFCTDDRNPLDIAEKGHLDSIIAHVIAAGVDPLVAYRVASMSASDVLGLHDRGLIAPGKRADIVLLDDLKTCKVAATFTKGKLFSPNEIPILDAPGPFLHTVRCREVSADDFVVPKRGADTPVIGVHDGSIITDYLRMDPDKEEDVLPMAVLERHGRNGNIGRAFVHGFGMKRGALASSVGHDSHNLCVVGTNTTDMAAAVNALRQSQGGLCVAIDGNVAGLLPLPVAGLMSNLPHAVVEKQ